MTTIDIISKALYSHDEIHTTTVDGEDLYLFTGGRIYWDEQDPSHPGWSYELWAVDEYYANVECVGSGALDTLGDLQRVIDHAVSEALNPSAHSDERDSISGKTRRQLYADAGIDG